MLDHDIEYRYEYALILGTLDEIRTRALALHGKPEAPRYTFDASRQGWHVRGGADRGGKLTGEWDVTGKAPELVGPFDFWRADEAPTLTLDGAFTAAEVRVYWATLDDPTFHADRSLIVPVVRDGVTRVNLAAAPGYRGALVRLRLDPGGPARLRSVSLVRQGDN